jgi:hypothetical protein
MADSSYEVIELRFVIKPELTECYVALQAFGDSPIGVQGWHHKTFPASMPVVDILRGEDMKNCVLWPLDAPD